MMLKGVKTRLVAFVALSAVGVVYAGTSYLELDDRLMGRGYSVSAVLPGTGGLYNGSLVTYRGVEIGKVSSMEPEGRGVRVDLALDDGAAVPADSPVFVHNGSAVGEQYLDFEPANDEGPYLGPGDTIHGNEDSLPVGEDELLLSLDQFVGSVNRRSLRTVIEELGLMFYETGRPLQDLLDGGGRFIDTAARNKAQTISLLENGRTVLRTQQANSDSIRAFADGLAQFTGALRRSDDDLRTVIEGGPGTMRQVEALMQGLEPTLPVLLSNVVTVNQVAAVRIPNIEQLLVTYPITIASGFAGLQDGYGKVHLDYTNEPPACRRGYLPPSRWRDPHDTSDGEIYLKAHCAEPPPYVMRGTKHAPRPGGPRARVAPYDPTTGAVDAGDRRYVLDRGGSRAVDVYGSNAWQWMLLGPTQPR